MLIRAAVLLALVGCTPIWHVWPVTPAIAARSTYQASGEVAGVAWVVDRGTLITSSTVCGRGATVEIQLSPTLTYTADVGVQRDGLCLLSVSPLVHLGPPLMVSRQLPYRAAHPTYTHDGSGSPVLVVGNWGQDPYGGGSYGYGVNGVRDGVLDVSLGKLHRFLRTAGVQVRWEPSGVDEDLRNTVERDHSDQENQMESDPAWMHDGE